MKVILLTDVPKVGNRNEIKELKDGFAQNVLIARGLAVLATPKAITELEAKKNLMNKKKETEVQTFSSLISSVGNNKIIIKAKANEKGHLFKSISSHDIAEAIKKETGVEIDTHAIVVDHIKSLGTHNVTIKKGDKKGECQIEVVAE